MLSGALSSSLLIGGWLILQIWLTFNTWVRPRRRIFPDNGGGKGDHSDDFNAAAPSCWKSEYDPLTISWVSEMYPTARVSNGSGKPNHGAGLERTHGSVRFEIHQTPDPLVFGIPHSAPYPSTHVVHRVWLDPSGPISGFVFRVVLFMVTFRYPSVNRTILTMVRPCVFGMYWQFLWSKYVDKRSLTHPGNEYQRRLKDFRPCILSNQSGHWLQRVITEVLASWIGKSRSDMHPAPSWKWASQIQGLTAWVI